MDWTDIYPRKKGFYWAISIVGTIAIFKRSGKTGLWGFGGDAIDVKKISFWGEKVEIPEEGWSKNEPVEEGWYAVTYDDKTKSIVRVAIGTVLHCYDYEIPSEIDMRKIVSWNGPLKVPSPPAKK